MNKYLKFYLSLPYIFLKLNAFIKRYAFDYVSKTDKKNITREILKKKLSKKEIIKLIENLEIQHKTRRLEIWNKFIEKELYVKYVNFIPKISNTPTITATIVEARKHPHLVTIVKNFISHTQHLNIALNIYHGTENENFIKDKFNGIANIKFINLGVDNLNIEAYNKVMLSKKFLSSISTDYYIVFQTDVITFKPLEKTFFDYDYVGAPWKRELHKEYRAAIGNGGLSIRSKKAMLKILDMNIPREENTPEDLYLAQILKHEKFKLPTFETALKFSTEDVFALDTFGCHKSWELINTRNLKKLLKQAIDA